MEEKYAVKITYHGTEFQRPWEVEKFTIRPEVGGAKNDMYATNEEALKEAVRFLASSLKLLYIRPEDSPIFKDVIDWWKCAKCERGACDGCDNMKKERLK